jgi:hypothetical protein
MKKRAILAAVLVLCLALGGCRAYKPHKKTFKYAVGTWTLDCVYVNTSPITIPQITMEISKDKQAHVTTVTTLALTAEEQALVDSGQEVTAQTTTTEADYDITADDKGVMIFKADDGTETTYAYSVDTEAGDLHMYTTIDGSYYHYVYYKVEE